MSKKVGLFGGSFDPPHIGHMIAAQESVWQCGLDEIWFVPTCQPPHQEEKQTAASAEQRTEMIERAVSEHSQFKLCLIEMERGGRSYTYDTIAELQRLYPENQFFFIIGADMVNDLPRWHKIDKLKECVIFIGLNRPGVDSIPPVDVSLITAQMPDISVSSTMIRARLKKHQPVRYFLQEKVRHYIKENDVYG